MNYYERSPRGGYWLAMVVALWVMWPVAATAQEDGAEADGGVSEESEEPVEARGPTPKYIQLPVQPVGDGVSSIIPERIGELLRDQLGVQSGIELLPRYATLREQLMAGGGGANAAVARANGLYTSGIGLLTAGEDKKASESFQQAVDIMEQNLGDVTNFNVLKDAYKNLALAYFRAGFDFDARKKMKVFAHLSPEASLDPETFPKELLTVYGEEAAKVAKAGPGKLVINGPEGVQITIDGELKGEAPLTVEDVGFGYHYMVARNARGDVWAEQIRVRGRGKEQGFEVEFGEDKGVARGDDMPAFYTDLLATIATGTFGEGLQPYLAELSTQAGTDYVGWVAMMREGMKYNAVTFVWRASDGRLVRGPQVSFNVELSNLMVGVSQLAGDLAELVETMPEEAMVSLVELNKPALEPDPPAEQQQEEQLAARGSDAGEASSGGAQALPMPQPELGDGEYVEPPPVVDEEREASRTWMYVGIGSGALLVGGLVAGGVILLSGDEDVSEFRTRVRW